MAEIERDPSDLGAPCPDGDELFEEARRTRVALARARVVDPGPSGVPATPQQRTVHTRNICRNVTRRPSGGPALGRRCGFCAAPAQMWCHRGGRERIGFLHPTR